MARWTRLTWVSLIGAMVSVGFALEAGATTLVSVQYTQSPNVATTVNGSFEYLQDHPADVGKPGLFDYILSGVSSPDKHTISYTLPSSSGTTESCAAKTCNVLYLIVVNNGTYNYSMHVTWTAGGHTYDVVLTFTTLAKLTKSQPYSNAFWQSATSAAPGTFSCTVDGALQADGLPITVTSAVDFKLAPSEPCPPTVVCYPVYAQPRRGCCLTRFFARNRFQLCRR